MELRFIFAELSGMAERSIDDRYRSPAEDLVFVSILITVGGI